MESSPIGKELKKEIGKIENSLVVTGVWALLFLFIIILGAMSLLYGVVEAERAVPALVVLGIIGFVLIVSFSSHSGRSSQGESGEFCDGGIEMGCDSCGDYYSDAGIGY